MKYPYFPDEEGRLPALPLTQGRSLFSPLPSRQLVLLRPLHLHPPHHLPPRVSRGGVLPALEGEPSTPPAPPAAPRAFIPQLPPLYLLSLSGFSFCQDMLSWRILWESVNHSLPKSPRLSCDKSHIHFQDRTVIS